MTSRWSRTSEGISTTETSIQEAPIRDSVGQGVERDFRECRGVRDANLLIEPLPSGWENCLFADVCNRVKESYKPVKGGATPYVGLEHLAPRFPAFVGCGTESEVKSSKTAFKVGDILFGKLRAYLRKGAQAYFDGISSTDILVFRAENRCISDFLKYLVHSDEFIEYAKSTTTGAQHPRTSWPSLREFHLALPPLPEQKKIAHILSTIQRAIEAQERIIQTTTELKKALMHKLFTEGLRNEPQKQTEIGSIPESWEVVPLKDVTDKPQYGLTTKAVKSGDTKFLRITDITDHGVNWSTVPYCLAPKKKIDTYKLETGDIVFARIGATTGKSHMISNPPDAVFASYLIRVRAGNNLESHYLIQFFQSPAYWWQIDANKHTDLKKGINGSILSELIIPLPPLSEQKKIAHILLTIQQKADNAQSKKSKLQVLFRTLLHELMTAKIRAHELKPQWDEAVA